MSEIVLYDYWRSSASYRVRIALNVLGLDYRTVPVNLLTRQHKDAAHLARNPQGLVPTLEIDGLMLTQSLAMIEYLDETRKADFLPADAAGRARVRTLSFAIAMEIHPICNTSVVNHVVDIVGGGDETREKWIRKFIRQGLVAFETMLDHPATGRFCHGDTPSIADFCLLPQLYNAERWGAETADLKRINDIARQCAGLQAFSAAFPDKVKPTES